MKLTQKVLLAAATMTWSLAASAVTMKFYDVNRQIGSNGSVVGTIATDGTLGVLSSANILGWSLTYSSLGTSTAPTKNTPADSQFVLYGPAVSADSDSLNFDFDYAATHLHTFLLFQRPYIGSGHAWWCLGDACGAWDPLNGPVQLTGESLRHARVTYSLHEGTLPFATINTALPEPATYAMFGVAVLGWLARGILMKRKLISSTSASAPS